MYIRTKDNLYEITDKQYDILCGNLTEEEKENFKNITSFGIGSVEEGTYKSVLIKDILKYSENLEELCDEFVYDYGKDKDRFKNDSLALKILKANNNEKVNIYGAVWTSKGLIYVAKMNDKGELELI